MKALGLTWELHSILLSLSTREGGRIPGVAVKCVISGGIPVAKAAPWIDTDAEVRKRGEQTGLDTLVVHAVNYVD